MTLRRPLRLDLVHRAPRNADFGELQETFLVAGVTMILVIRTQLWLTNYPQLGGHGLHIAHLLWGGLFMVVAIWILVTFLGRPPRRLAAVVGGVGFGFFIDELGKFVTADNNYFFKPAAALIYLIFVGLFMLSRALRRRGGLTSADCVANVLDLVEDAARRRFDERDRSRALELLARADPTDPIVTAVRGFVLGLKAAAPGPPSRITRAATAVRDGYGWLVRQRWFRPALTWVFAFWALASVIDVFELVLSVGVHLGGAMRGYRSDAIGDLRFINLASLASSLLSAALVFAGLRRLRAGDRSAAYRRFERALFVSIFVTRVFAFVESQFGAVFGLAIDLVLLVALRTMMTQEAELPRRDERAAAALAPAPRAVAR